MHNDRPMARRNIFHTAGWLFADLLLALTIIFIAASATGKPISKATPSVTPTPIPTRTSTTQALDPHPLKFTINVDPFQLNSPDTITSVKGQAIQQLNQSHNGTRKVGFVITLAGGIAGDDHAMSFNAILMSTDPFQGAVFKNYHDLGHPESEFDLEIYFTE
jgi:hypothetical protein